MRSNLKNSASIVTLALRAAPTEGNGQDEMPYDAKTIKAEYKKVTGNALAIKDNILVQLLEQNPAFDDMDSEEQIKFLTAKAEQVKGIAIADPAISALVAKIEGSAKQSILDTVDRIIRSKASALDCLAVFRSIYTKDEMAGFAFPGLEKDKMEPGDNRKPDIVTTIVRSTKEEITTVWTDDFCSAWGPCKAWETDMDDLKKELKSSGSVSRFSKLGKVDLTNMLKTVTAQRNALRSMVKRAITFEHQITAIEGLPKVTVSFARISDKDTTSKHVRMPIVYGKGDNLTDKDCIRMSLSPSPIWLAPKGEEMTNSKPYSVTQINNMDIRAAIAAGGEMGDLTDTIKKGPDGETETETDGADADIAEAYAFTVKTANWFARRENIAAMRKILNDPKHEDHNDWLQLVGDIYTAIAPTFRRNRKAYEALGNPDAVNQDAEDEAKTGTDG